MVRASAHARRQHYVPRFLLRGFARGKGKQVAVFDKRDSRSFRAGIADIGVKGGFYDFPVERGVATLEPGLGRLEDRAARAIDEIRRHRATASLDIDARAAVAALVVNLFVRGPGHRARVLDSMHQIKRLLELMNAGREPASQQIRDLMAISEADAKLISLRLTSDPSALLPHILDKDVILFGTTRDCPFVVGDTPVVMANGMPATPKGGNLALGVPGVEIYLPLSETLTLGLFSKEAVEGVVRAGELERKRAEAGVQGPSFFTAIHMSIASGEAVISPASHVHGLNERQVTFAERYVFAGDDVFGEMRALLNRQSRLRKGPRFVVSHPLLDAEREVGGPTPAGP